ncbi:hypothetical protein PZC41_14435 [Staphylococcus aureus]|uniref:hypothetical protein n=1 Tax=Staphylococcus aureus TaxID=1280 RepID=UPI0023B13B69|nr:hypothetical protein [Staphylococcus aureus]MDE8535502.1 hypothetical protein [Staphylococcus aureus]
MNAELFRQNFFVILCTERIAPAIQEHDAELAAKFADVTMETNRNDLALDIARALDIALDIVLDIARARALDLGRALALALALDLALDLALARDLALGLALDLARALDRARARDGLRAYEIADGKPLAIEDIDNTILAEIEAGTCEFDMSDWQSCRGGQAIRLAPGGEELAAIVGRPFAAAMIYAASRPGQPLPDFFASDEEAIADMRHTIKEQTQ